MIKISKTSSNPSTCWKYKNQHGTVFIWCKIANGKECGPNYLRVFTDLSEDYYNHYNYCPYCGNKLKVKEK